MINAKSVGGNADRFLTFEMYDMRHIKNGFTLIELLVAISIVAVLLGLLLPALASARQQGRMTAELSANRQLGQAYIAYALDHNDGLLVGNVKEPSWKYDDRGHLLTPSQAAEKWPWRLMRYIDYGMHGSLLVNKQSDRFSDRSEFMWSYFVSMYPSFGLNLPGLGGDEKHPENNLPGYLTKLPHASQPSRMIVFTSAAADDDMGANGFWRIEPPHMWTSEEYHYPESGPPVGWGFVHPRWDNTAIVAHLDGHSERLTLDDMRDMTRWSDRAARAGDANWTP